MFAHLHLHDTYSLLDGYGTPEMVAKYAAELGFIALAQTNHGTISGHISHKKYCMANNIHPVYGCEFYIVKDMHKKGLTEEEQKDIGLKAGNSSELEQLKKELAQKNRARSHILVLAKTQEGYQNLRTLVSVSFIDGFYRKPRIDYKTLVRYGKGLFVSTACMAGDVPRAILSDDIPLATKLIVGMKERFEDFALEIMPLDDDKQRVINLGIQDLSKKLDIPVIATNDVHYIRKEDGWAQDVMLAIGTGKSFDDPNRLRFGNNELFLRSEDEMIKAFTKFHRGLDKKFVLESINQTYKVAFESKADPLSSIASLPNFELPLDWNDRDAYLRHLCGLGWKRRGMHLWSKEIQDIYGKRVAYELSIVKDKKFSNYFLLVWDMVQWAREKKIGIGPARGSAAGSMISYLIGITAIDPIRFNLPFERFIAPHRKDYPDIDIDFEDVRRVEIKDYLIEKYGREHVANISTMNTLKFKGAFRDACRTFDVPQQEVNRVIGYFDVEDEIEEDESGAIISKDFELKYPDVIKATKALIGQLRAGGTHAAGVVIADHKLKDITSLELRNDVPVVALTKDEAESLGLIKIDILGLSTITVITAALVSVNKRRKLENLDEIVIDDLTTSLNDPKVIAEFAAGNTEAVFQFNKPGGKRLCQEIAVTRFEDLAAVNALDRPGPLESGGTDAYLKNKKLKGFQSIHPIYDNITKETHGVLLYQEQVMAICRDLANLDWPEVHAIRKVIAKSQGADVLEGFWQSFKTGIAGSRTDCSEQTARKIWDMIVKHGGYGFNKCIDIHTPVLTMHGIKEAQNLRKGDKIFVADPDGLHKSEVIGVYDQGFLNGYEATFDDGSKVVCSLDHKFYTNRGDLSLADIIKTGAKVAATEKTKDWWMDLPRMQDGLSSPMGKTRAPQNLFTFSRRAPTNSFSNNVFGLAESSTRYNSCGIRNSKENVSKTGSSGCQSIMSCYMASIQSRQGEGNYTQDDICKKTSCGTIFKNRADGCFHTTKPQKKFPNQMQGHGSGSRFCSQRYLGRGRWSLSFLPVIRTRTPSAIVHSRRGVESGSREARDQVDSGGAGLFHGFRSDQADLQTGRVGCPSQPATGSYVYRRLISVISVGPRKMVDIEVRAPHLFALANGLISHNSHAVAYAAIGYATMWMKVYYPAEYLCEVMNFGSNPREAVNEARKRDVIVKEPDINKSGIGYTLQDGIIYAGFESVHGIGEVSAKGIIDARGTKPFDDYNDFIQRTSGKKVHKGIVSILIDVGAFESIHKNTVALGIYHKSKTNNVTKQLGLFDISEKELYNETFNVVKNPIDLICKRVSLLPFIPMQHSGLEFDHILNKRDKLFPPRTTIANLKSAGRAYARNEIRTITGILTNHEVKHDSMKRKKVGQTTIEDETGSIIVLLDTNRFPIENDSYAGKKGRPIMAIVSPISEYRADVREIADLILFDKFIETPENLSESMDNILKAPGREVMKFRKDHKTLKRAINLKKAKVIGLAMRVWSGRTKNGEMGFVDLADETFQQIVLIWPDSWKTINGTIEEGKIYEAVLGVTKDKTLCCDVRMGHCFKEI